LKLNRTITKLDNSGNASSDIGFQYLTDVYKVNTSIRNFSIGNWIMNEICARNLADALRVNTALHELCLTDIENLKPKMMKYIVDSIRENPHSNIHLMNFSKTKMSSKNMKFLSNLVQTNTTIRELILRGCHIYHQGGQYLAEALMRNSTLEYLSMESNFIGNPGGIRMAEMLEMNTTLKTLFLGCNRMNHISGIRFVEMLRRNTTLVSMYLNDKFGQEVPEAFINVLQTTNTTLRYLTIDISGPSRKVLERIMKERSSIVR
jgi:hypothetical protein